MILNLTKMKMTNSKPTSTSPQPKLQIPNLSWINQHFLIGIDPGTTTGISVYNPGGTITLNEFSCSVGKKYPAYYRMGMFYDKLNEAISGNLLAKYNDKVIICYEGLKHFSGSRSAHAVAVGNEIRGVLQAFCYHSDLYCFAANVSSLKKMATGKGNANKELMESAAKSELKSLNNKGMKVLNLKPGRSGIDAITDNQADAFFCMLYASTVLSNASSQ